MTTFLKTIATLSFSTYMFWTFAVHADSHVKKDSSALRDKVTVVGIRAHQRALQNIADENDGTRVAGTTGYTASAAYVKERMEQAGYQVTLQNFPITLSHDQSPPELAKIHPENQVFVPNVDFASITAMGTSELTGEIEAVDFIIPSPAPNTSTSGCEDDDFKNFTEGNIALIQRGTCTFRVKVDNAIKAGASGVIIFNEGNIGRTGFISSRIATSVADFPVLGASFMVGEALRGGKLAGPTGVQAFVKVDVSVTTHSVENVIAETPGGDKNRVLVIGAHLDSVEDGPGMNDNGSGSASILEIALKYAELGVTPSNKLRFIWFSAEEFGLLGSEFYVNSLSEEENASIFSMLNFDMLGSANYARFVYDGDNSSKTIVAQAGPEGSDYLERIFLDYFSGENLVTHPTPFNGRSDYGPFIEVGIPAGGLFSGAEGIKSAALKEIYGGVAGAPFDPCYHRACDDYAHTGEEESSLLALTSIDELSDAAAHAVFTLADTTDKVRVPKPLPEKNVVEFEYRGGLLIK